MVCSALVLSTILLAYGLWHSPFMVIVHDSSVVSLTASLLISRAELPHA